MSYMNVKYNNMNIVLDEGVEIPQYQTEGAAGFDLTAVKVLNVYKGSTPVSSEKLKKIQESFLERGYIKIRGFERILFGTGIKVAVPQGFEMQLRPRSGTALKKGLTLCNTPGTIDSDYRGEVGAIILNTSNYLATIDKGERICQAVVSPVVQISLDSVESLDTTDRGEGGFGSTNLEKV